LRYSKGQHSIHWLGAQHFVEFLQSQNKIGVANTSPKTIQPSSSVNLNTGCKLIAECSLQRCKITVSISLNCYQRSANILNSSPQTRCIPLS
jgi:hypothetical protein